MIGRNRREAFYSIWSKNTVNENRGWNFLLGDKVVLKGGDKICLCGLMLRIRDDGRVGRNHVV